MKLITTPSGQTIIGEQGKSFETALTLINPAVLVIKNEGNTGRFRIHVEPFFPREILSNPDEKREMVFNRSSIVAEYDTEFNAGITQNYKDINLPLEELRKKYQKEFPAPSNEARFPVDNSKIIQL